MIQSCRPSEFLEPSWKRQFQPVKSPPRLKEWWSAWRKLDWMRRGSFDCLLMLSRWNRFECPWIEVTAETLADGIDYDIDLAQFSPHALASALKAYFRQIPTPLIPPQTYELFGGVFGRPVKMQTNFKTIPRTGNE